jgi:hypothetical protein
MRNKRAPAAVHSKKADHLGRSKNRRHGTRDWTKWDGTPRPQYAAPSRGDQRGARTSRRTP